MSDDSRKNFNHFIAGFAGGLVSTSIVHPLDFVKVRIQTNCSKFSTYEALKIVYRKSGLTGFYRGFGPNVLGNCTAWGTYMYMFKLLNSSCIDRNKQLNIDKLTISQTYLNASFAGLISLVITNPLWMIKVNMCLADRSDRKYRNLFRASISVYNDFGIRGFYKGFIPGLFGIFHGCFMMTSYEFLKSKALSTRATQGVNKLNTLDIITVTCLSKIIATSLTYPYQVLRARLMMVSRENKSSRILLMQILKNETIFGLYKGLFVSILRVLPAACITLLTYETTFKMLNHL